MENGRKLFNIAAILTIINGVILLPATSLFASFIIGIGIAMLIFSSHIDEDIYKKYKSVFLIFAILLLLFSPIAGILLFVAIDRFNTGLANAPPKDKKNSEKNKVSKEVRKIDLLLKLGVLMVSISGLLFATTKWDIITGVMKCIVLLVIALVFLFLYKYTKEKLKLVKSSNSYYALGIMFFALAFIAMVYFEVIGTWFTYYGGGKYLAYSFTFGIIGVLTYLVVNKINLRKTIYLAYLSLYLSLYFILKFCYIDGAIICLILELISFFILLILKDEQKHSLFKFNKLLSYLYFILIISTSNGNLSIPCEIVGIGLLMYLLGINKDKNSSLLIPVIANIIVITISSNFTLLEVRDYIYLLLANIIYFIISIVKDKNKSISITNDLIYCFSMIICAAWASTDSMKFLSFAAASIFFVMVLIVCSKKIKMESTAIIKYASIPAIFMFILSSMDMLNEIVKFDTGIAMTFVILAYALVHSLIKNKALKTTYLIIIYITTYFCLLISFTDEITASIAAIVGLGYLIRYSSKNIDLSINKGLNIFNFILFLIGIYNLFITCDLLEMPGYFSSLLVSWIYLVIYYFLKDENKKKALLLTLCIPLFTFVESLTDLINYDLIMILYNMIYFYIVIIIAKCFIKDKSKLNVLVSVGVILCLLNIVFNRSLAVALYVGIISLIIMFIGYYKENVRTLFKIGLVAIIFNIFYQLYDVLKMIPFWIYLLVVGLGLIAFVTIKETKKLPSDDKDKG